MGRSLDEILTEYLRPLLLYACVMKFIMTAERVLSASSYLMLTVWRSPYVLHGGCGRCRILDDYASADRFPSTIDSGCRRAPPLQENYTNRVKEEPAAYPMDGVGGGIVIHLERSDEESTVPAQSEGVVGIASEASRPIGRMGGNVDSIAKRARSDEKEKEGDAGKDSMGGIFAVFREIRRGGERGK